LQALLAKPAFQKYVRQEAQQINPEPPNPLTHLLDNFIHYHHSNNTDYNQGNKLGYEHLQLTDRKLNELFSNCFSSYFNDPDILALMRHHPTFQRHYIPQKLQEPQFLAGLTTDQLLRLVNHPQMQQRLQRLIDCSPTFRQHVTGDMVLSLWRSALLPEQSLVRFIHSSEGEQFVNNPQRLTDDGVMELINSLSFPAVESLLNECSAWRQRLTSAVLNRCSSELILQKKLLPSLLFYRQGQPLMTTKQLDPELWRAFSNDQPPVTDMTTQKLEAAHKLCQAIDWTAAEPELLSQRLDLVDPATAARWLSPQQLIKLTELGQCDQTLLAQFLRQSTRYLSAENVVALYRGLPAQRLTMLTHITANNASCLDTLLAKDGLDGTMLQALANNAQVRVQLLGNNTYADACCYLQNLSQQQQQAICALLQDESHLNLSSALTQLRKIAQQLQQHLDALHAHFQQYAQNNAPQLDELNRLGAACQQLLAKLPDHGCSFAGNQQNSASPASLIQQRLQHWVSVVDAWQQLQQALHDEQTTYCLQQHRRPTIRRMMATIANLLHRIGYLLRLYQHAELRHEPATCRLKRLPQQAEPSRQVQNSKDWLAQIDRVISAIVQAQQAPFVTPVFERSNQSVANTAQSSQPVKQRRASASAIISQRYFWRMPGDDSSDIKQRPSFYSTTFMN
jgi:uncharacterized coiled-coil protein SlyX